MNALARLGWSQGENDVFYMNDLIKEFSKDLEGSGGGQDFFATASGKKINKVPDVIKKINSFLLAN